MKAIQVETARIWDGTQAWLHSVYLGANMLHMAYMRVDPIGSGTPDDICGTYKWYRVIPYLSPECDYNVHPEIPYQRTKVILESVEIIERYHHIS